MKYLSLIMLVCLLCVCSFFSGCASIIHGSTQKISVSSNPAGAKIQADGNSVGNAPVSVELKRKTDHILVFTKDGYKQEQVTIMHVVSGAVYGNIAAGGLIGWGVDAATGAQFKLVPETISMDLTPQKQETHKPEAPPAQLSVEDRLKRLKELFDQKHITEKEYETNRKLVLASVSGIDNKTKEPNAADDKNEIPKKVEDKSKPATDAVEETKNTKQEEKTVPLPTTESSTSTTDELITLDGYDAKAARIVHELYLWRDYKNPVVGVSATATHGEKVKLILKEGDHVLVETLNGKKGWVNSSYIKEFK